MPPYETFWGRWHHFISRLYMPKEKERRIVLTQVRAAGPGGREVGHRAAERRRNTAKNNLAGWSRAERIWKEKKYLSKRKRRKFDIRSRRWTGGRKNPPAEEKWNVFAEEEVLCALEQVNARKRGTFIGPSKKPARAQSGKSRRCIKNSNAGDRKQMNQ